MENKKYIMIGTPNISKEIFRKPLRPLDNYNTKPTGGFWSSNYICKIGPISEWYEYLLDADGIAYYKDMTTAVAFTLKDNANILIIDNEQTIQALKEKYPSYHHILNNKNNDNPEIDFEELAQHYDGIYLNYDKIWLSDISFNSWSINTLLLFNLDCIKEYQSINIESKHFEEGNPYSYLLHYVKEESDKKTVQPRSQYYEEIYNYVETTFLEYMQKYQYITFKDYEEYLEAVINCTNECIKILYHNNEKDIQKIKEVLKSQELNFKKITIIRNLVLNYLSSYLSNDKKRIKTLNKSNNTKIKYYPITEVE